MVTSSVLSSRAMHAIGVGAGEPMQVDVDLIVDEHAGAQLVAR